MFPKGRGPYRCGFPLFAWEVGGEGCGWPLSLFDFLFEVLIGLGRLCTIYFLLCLIFSWFISIQKVKFLILLYQFFSRRLVEKDLS